MLIDRSKTLKHKLDPSNQNEPSCIQAILLLNVFLPHFKAYDVSLKTGSKAADTYNAMGSAKKAIIEARFTPTFLAKELGPIYKIYESAVKLR